jgi:hypothetical protein
VKRSIVSTETRENIVTLLGLDTPTRPAIELQLVDRRAKVKIQRGLVPVRRERLVNKIDRAVGTLVILVRQVRLHIVPLGDSRKIRLDEVGGRREKVERCVDRE